MRALLIAITVPLLGCGHVVAREGSCMARPLMDVPAEEAPEQIRSKGNGAFGPVSTIKVDKKSGKMVYCSATSYCYNSNAFELTAPCRIKRDMEQATSKYFVFFTR